MAAHVFISHSSADRSVAVAICDALEAAGHSVWMAPRDVGPGDIWGEAIVNAIDASGVMLVVLSASANASPDVLREVSRAADHGIRVVPLRIEDLRPTGALAYFLSNHQWLDAFPGPFPLHLPRVVAAVAEVTGRRIVDAPASAAARDTFVEVVPDRWSVDPRRRRGAWLRSLFEDK